MVHYGKHIIDPDTGLCEICDRGAIHDFRQGKRSGRQFLYSNQHGKFTYRPNDEEIRYNNEETTTPRYVRKPLYPEPSTVRTRPTVHEEPVVVKKKVPRRDHSPIDDNQNPSNTRPTTFYYVDNSGQMYPRNEGPPDERHRRYLVPNQQHHHSPPTTRSTHVVQRRARTPPPPASESWRSRPKRKNNSDTEILHRPYQPSDPYYNQSPRRAEMYHIDNDVNNTYHPTISSIVQGSHDPNRKQRQLEPIERKHRPEPEPIERKYRSEPEPTVIRKVYKKLPKNKYENQEVDYIPNGHYVQPVRKIEKIYPSPRKHDVSPQMTNKYTRSPVPTNYPSVYHIQSVDEY